MKPLVNAGCYLIQYRGLVAIPRVEQKTGFDVSPIDPGWRDVCRPNVCKLASIGSSQMDHLRMKEPADAANDTKLGVGTRATYKIVGRIYVCLYGSFLIRSNR